MAVSTLHLIDAASPQATPATLAQIRLTRAHEDRVLLLGPDSLQRDARAAGLTKADRINLPLGPVLLSLAGFCHHLRQHPAPQRFVCWSVRSLSLAALARPNAMKLLQLTAPMDDRRVRQLRRIIRHQPRRVQIAIANPAIGSALVAGGIAGELIHPLPPVVDPARLAPPLTRGELREALQLDARTPVIALLSDPPVAGDARHAALAVGLAGESMSVQWSQAEKKTLAPRLLVMPTQRRRPLAADMMRAVGTEHLLIQHAGAAEPWRVLPACDAAIAVADAPPTLSLAWAATLGVPIAAERCAAVEQWLTDEQSALLSPAGQAKTLAHRLERCLSDAALRDRLATGARRRAETLFSERARERAQAELDRFLTAPAWVATNHEAPQADAEGTAAHSCH